MTDERLRKLLRSADEGAPIARQRRVDANDLIAALARRRRQRTRRRAMVSCAAVVLALVGWQVTHNGDQAEPELAALPTVEAPLALIDALNEVRQLEREAEHRLRVVRQLQQAEATERAPAAVDAERSPELLAQETARSAAISLQSARQTDEEFNDAASARREYQRIVERFPGTPWADQAALSLRRISG